MYFKLVRRYWERLCTRSGHTFDKCIYEDWFFYYRYEGDWHTVPHVCKWVWGDRANREAPSGATVDGSIDATAPGEADVTLDFISLGLLAYLGTSALVIYLMCGCLNIYLYRRSTIVQTTAEFESDESMVLAEQTHAGLLKDAEELHVEEPNAEKGHVAEAYVQEAHAEKAHAEA